MKLSVSGKVIVSGFVLFLVAFVLFLNNLII